MTKRLEEVSPELQRLLVYLDLPKAQFAVPQIRCQTVQVSMRDGIRLSTDVYLPPVRPAPVVVVRTPYDRSQDRNGYVGVLMALARRGYVVVSQDVRGTGESEPESWDYYVFETEDSYDLIEWIIRQEWFGGFIGSFSLSYDGQTQWCMAMHPAMSTIVPGVSGLGVAVNTAHLHMNLNAYARTAGKGEDKVPVPFAEMERRLEPELMASGFFNEPLFRPFSAALLERFPNLRQLAPVKAQRWLWEHYCALTCAERAEFVKLALGVRNITAVDVESLSGVFGRQISHDALTVPHPNPAQLCGSLQAPGLMITGWYDWGLNDALATWELLRREGQKSVRSRSRLLITPNGHTKPGYWEDGAYHPESLRTAIPVNQVQIFLGWYEAVRQGTTDSWPPVIYYLMGAHEWRVASDWPVPGAQQVALYLGAGGTLTRQPPRQSSPPHRYVYNPLHPTPTVGGSVHTSLYPSGCVDVSEVQKRSDVIVYTSPPLEHDVDVVGPLRMVLYASSNAVDTDFVARLSDVFPDGRALQLQSGILRARYRDLEGGPQLLERGRIYRLEIDLWATANRFKAGHRLRVDISSADFPHYDRNSNRGDEAGEPIPAQQSVYHDSENPSHLLLSVLGSGVIPV